jgi:hypothetical protein
MRALRFPVPASDDAPFPWVIDAERREQERRETEREQPRLDVPAYQRPVEVHPPAAGDTPPPGSTVIVIPL